jgi:hypothetical protein
VHTVIDVELPAPRGAVLDVKSDPAFIRARDTVADEIRAGSA